MHALKCAIATVAVAAVMPAAAIADSDHGMTMPGSTHVAKKAMSVKAKVSKDSMKGYNLKLSTKGFRWAPQHAGMAFREGEGHAHLYVDGAKVTRYRAGKGLASDDVYGLLPARDGSIWVGERSDRSLTSVAAPIDDRVAHVGFHFGASFIEVARFCDAVRNGTGADVDVNAGLWSVAVGVAAHRSIDEGRPVLIDELGV